jgi:type VI secretion system protein ImpE
MTAKDNYQRGDLQGAIAASVEAVKAKPGDIAARAFLSELFCFNGQLDRADGQLEAIGKLDTKAVAGVAMMRQLVRAETARQQFFTEGRVPEFLTKPAASLETRLRASVELRAGNYAAAAAHLAEAEAARPPVSGTIDGRAFSAVRDLDDLLSGVLEVLTSTGKYYWVPFENIDSISFHKPDKPRDILWRPADMTVRDGPEGVVYLPTLYPGTHTHKEDAALQLSELAITHPEGGAAT